MTRSSPTISEVLNRWTGPLGMLSVLVGGVVWLTTLHGLSEQNARDIAELRATFDQNKNHIDGRLNDLDTRLGRIEGKLDMLIDNRKR